MGRDMVMARVPRAYLRSGVGGHGLPAGSRRTARTALATAATAALAAPLLGVPAAQAYNASHGDRVVSADPASFTPHVMNGSVNAIVQVGRKVIAAGTFTSVSPAGTPTDTGDDLIRNRIFAFDAVTGAIDPSFDPNLGGSANSLAVRGTDIYVGGAFGSVGGNTAIKRVVKLTSAGAVVPTFKAVPNKAVAEVVVSGDRVFLGGAFTSIKSGATLATRNALAALHPDTGAVDGLVNVPFTGLYNGGSTNIKRFDVSPDGNRLVAVGNFTTVGGASRSQIAVLATPAGAPAQVSDSWATDRFSKTRNSGCASVFDTFMRDVDFSPDGSYFVVSTTGAFGGGANSGTLCDTITRWETSATGNDPTWLNYTGGDTSYGVAITDAAVYLGGHMRWLNNPFAADQAGPGAVPRSGIAALDPLNGLPLSWNPGRTRGVGAQALHAVAATAETPAGLWVGSDTTRIGGEEHRRIAFLPLLGGKTVPAVAPTTLPNDLFLAERAGAPGATGRLLKRSVDASGSPTSAAVPASTAIDWATLRGAFLVGGTLYYGLGDGALYSRSFTAATGAVGAQRTVNLYDAPDGKRIPFPIADVTGMFYDTATHRLYYTLLGNSALFYRYFTPESEVVGAQTFQAASNGVDFSRVAGMTLAGGKILYGSSADGKLRSASFGNGAVTGPGNLVPGVDPLDLSWSYRAMFAPNG